MLVGAAFPLLGYLLAAMISVFFNADPLDMRAKVHHRCYLFSIYPHPLHCPVTSSACAYAYTHHHHYYLFYAGVILRIHVSRDWRVAATGGLSRTVLLRRYDREVGGSFLAVE